MKVTKHEPRLSQMDVIRNKFLKKVKQETKDKDKAAKEAAKTETEQSK